MALISSETIIQHSLNQVSTEVNNDLMILDIEHGSYIKLDEIGKTIWLELENPKSFADLVKALQQQFDATEEEIATETKEFVENLVGKKLLELL